MHNTFYVLFINDELHELINDDDDVCCVQMSENVKPVYVGRIALSSLR